METFVNVLQNPLVLLCVFGTACYVLTLLTRRIVETASPDLKKQADANDSKLSYKTTFSRWWNEVILYSISPVYGMLLALLLRKTILFPEEFQGSTTLVVMSGLTCGFLCSWFYKAIKRAFSSATHVPLNELDSPDSNPQPPA
jgi:hypothetical protein